jgi:hypothetical protein
MSEAICIERIPSTSLLNSMLPSSFQFKLVLLIAAAFGVFLYRLINDPPTLRPITGQLEPSPSAELPQPALDLAEPYVAVGISAR